MTGSLAGERDRAIAAHYSNFRAATGAVAELAKRGVDVERLRPSDLEPFDQLHTAGAGATRIMVNLLALAADARVLDVGSGLGGPARVLAASADCSVDGVDLTPAFVALATDFTRRTRQADRVRFHVASATALPFAAATFDAAWHIHMSMNVPDKAAMYREIARVLKPGGRFALFDPVRGNGPAPHYPVPWSDTADNSFLISAIDLQRTIVAAGFKIERCDDVTAEGLAWFADLERRKPPISDDTPQSRFAAMSVNHRANLATGAVALLRGVFVRAS